MNMDNLHAFMTKEHHVVRNFVVRELPRNHGKPLSPTQIASALRLDVRLVVSLIDDLEKHLFFLVRDAHGNVSWAFPVTSHRTPHRLRFSTGEQIFGAWAEDSVATPFVEGRLRNERLEVEIATSCAHCDRPLHILVNERLSWRVRERNADPRLFLPSIDWSRFRGRNITGDYWRNSVFFWSEEHVRPMKVEGRAVDLNEAAKLTAEAQTHLFGFWKIIRWMASQQRTRRVFLGQTVAGAAALAAQTPGSSSVPPTTSGFLKRPGAEIYYETTGSGPAIVFAHGLGGNHLSWWQQVPHFAQRFTCVTFAHRGFSPSRLDAPAPDPALFTDDLAALIDHLKLADVRLIAQSMGGWTCLDYALLHPDRVRALVMAATGGTTDLNTLDPSSRERIESWSASNREAGTQLTRRGIHPAAGDRMARERPALHFLYREIDRLSGGGFDKEALRAKLIAARTLPASALKRLRMPVLFISGTEDVVFPPPAAAALAAAIPAAKLERVPEAGHSVYFERPETFNRLVGAFL